MKLSKPVIVIGAILALLIVIRVVISNSSGGDDQQQIEQALDDSIKASKEGRPGGVMDKLSDNLKVNSQKTSGNRSQIANYIKENRPDVIVKNRHAVVSGDEAKIESSVEIELNILGQTRKVELNDVTMTFRKEDDHIYVFIPVQRWKLAEVQVPESSLNDLLQ